MLRRKATKIEVKLDDKEELEESRKRASTTATAASSTSISSSTATAASSLLQHFDRSSLNPSTKSHRIGLSP